MVTAGANQAFTNVVLTLLDSASKAVLFKPYYFNHLMAIQMTGGADNVVFGRYTICRICTLGCCATWQSDMIPTVLLYWQPTCNSHNCLSRVHASSLQVPLVAA